MEHHQGELFPRVGFIVTNLIWPSRAVGTVLQQAGHGGAVDQRRQAGDALDTADRCHRFRANEVRLWLSVLAYNLGNLWRRLVLPKRIDNWSLTSLQQRLVKTGGRAGETCPVLLARAGRGASDAAGVRGNGAADRGAAGARWIAWAMAAGISVETEARRRSGVCGADSTGGSSGFGPGRGGSRPFLGTTGGTQEEKCRRNDSKGGTLVYTHTTPGDQHGNPS